MQRVLVQDGVRRPESGIRHSSGSSQRVARSDRAAKSCPRGQLRNR
ncbi:hypothetical protein [Teichococcus aestuarii]